ncbi:protein AF1q [Mustelus asterias]
MSKRKAEDFVCYRPRKRFLSLFVDCQGLRRHSSAKRKLQAEPPQEPACKRLENAGRRAEPGDRSASGAEPGDRGASGAEPGDRDASGAHPGSRGASGAQPGDCGASGAQPGDGSWPQTRGLGAGEPWASRSLTGSSLPGGTAQNAPQDEESCQYNSFQFWRVPLPVVELAEIEDFGQLRIAEEMNCEDPEEAAEIEMELQN